ncbi:DsbA family protein [Nitrospirillum viridazoti]|uniref:DsbA family protein n=1 Tax=Nitrospirillum viridazoti TaxID=3144925 RepID=UPI000AB4869A|nr:DsbA family protein [Nitrospirillum amazonense]TWB35306.1 protein-disulfide isomerase [Nitrospirillum amazonense]
MRTILLALLTSCLLLSSTATQAARPADDFDARIHAYLINHPEVLTEMQQALTAKQAAEREAQTRAVVAANHDALMADAGDAILGNPKGDVTVVEFFDDECPYCKMMAPTLETVVKTDPGVRVVLKELAVLGPGSEIAARYALAAQQQGKYLTLHAALMADKTPEHQLTEARVKEIAAGVGLDTARLERDSQSADIVVRLQRTRALAQTIGIRGTPGLVIGDTVHSGAMTPDALVKTIAAARAAKGP